MEPTRDTHATLIDLLDRVLDKGLILDADLIIHVAGIPLLGVKLKAALAGMETMLKYGIWQDWDEAQRAVATEEHRRKKEIPLVPGEEILVKIFASQWYSNGIYRNWRAGHLYITDRRMLLLQKEPTEILFQCPFREIKGVAIARETNITGQETNYLYLWLRSGEVAQLHPSDAQVVKKAVEERMKALGLELDEDLPPPMLQGAATRALSNGEQLIHSGKMSHLVAEPRPGDSSTDVWKPGYLYLTSQRLAWWYNFDAKVAFAVPLDRISAVEVERRDLGGALKNRTVLDLAHRNGAGDEIACFSGTTEELNQWQKMLSQIIAEKRSAITDSLNADSDRGLLTSRRKEVKVQNECR